MHYQKANKNYNSAFVIKIKYGKAQTIGPSQPILLKNSKQLMPHPRKQSVLIANVRKGPCPMA